MRKLFILLFGLLNLVSTAQNYVLDFDGSNDHITTTIDADLDVMPSTTWSGWIKPTGVSGWQVIFGMEDGGWDRFLIIENGGLGLSMGKTTNRWMTGVSVIPGQWQHVVAIYDNGSMRFYYNGTEYVTNDQEGNHSSTGKFTIGGNQTHAPQNYYRGLIDEVAVWNEALTASEISALYNSGVGLDASVNSGNYSSSSNLVGYFKMNEGNGTTINDSSGNEASGSMASPYTANWVADNTFNFTAITTPKIERTQISLDNSTVSVTFSDTIYGGTANATSTLEVSDFSLTISGGSASLSSATPSSISVSGTTIGLGIPLTGTPDGKEILTITPVDNSIFSVSGDTVSSTQSSNTVQLISNIVSSGLILYLDATNQNSYSGSGNIWYDLSGNNNDFNLNGPTFNLSGYFDFDGTNDFAKTVSTLNLSQYDHVTVQINMLAENTNKVELTYEHSENWNSNIGGFGLSNQSGGSTYINNLHHTNHDRGGIYRNYETNILNEWHQQTNIFSSVDDPTGRLTYIDGNLLNYSVQPSGSYPTGKSTTNSLNFGNYHFYLSSRAGSNYFLNGKVKSILIYGTKLSSSQIHQNYDALNDIPPTDISLTSNTISETASLGSFVGTLSATDSDTSVSSLTFSFTSSGDAQDDDNGSFTISGTSLLTSTTLDYETKTSYNIYVNVNDGTSNYAKAFTVSVTNVLEPITDLGFEVASIVTDGLILHLDAGDSNSYSGSGNTWNDISGNSNHFDINNVATHNNEGYFLFNNTLVNGTGMIGPPSNSFGLSQTNHTIELVMMPTAARGSIINFRGDSHDYAINVHVPWSNNNIYYDVGGCCGTSDRINGERNIVGQKIHIIFRSRPSTNPKREVILNGTSILNSGVNNTSTNNFTNIPVTLGGFMYNNNSSDHSVSARLYSVKVYNRALTDTEVAINFTSSTTITGGTSTSTISIDEEVSTGTLVGNLTATDSDSTSFTFSLVAGDGTNDRNNSSFTISGTQLLVAGNIDYETNSTLNIYVQASDGTNTFSKALTVSVNDVNELPVISSTSIASDNSTVSVIFSESVFGGTSQSTTTLATDDFNLSLAGGNATLSSTTPSSITVNASTVQLGLSLTGTPNGNEVITVAPIANAIFDVQGATASSTQSNNTVNLNADSDGDGITDPLDQCANTPNGEAIDLNGCAESQKDPDNDGITGANDNCPTVANADQADADGDGVGDVCDNCKNVINSNQVDTDGDGIGNACDDDDDNDGIADAEDTFPLNASESVDSDGDGIGDEQDPDADNDGVADEDDNCITVANADQADMDNDGIGDVCDDDIDGDGYENVSENICGSNSLIASSTPDDLDGDFIPDCVDSDIDGDGYENTDDFFPLDKSEWIDSDNDGIGDNADTDDDNDNWLDADELECGTDPLDSSDTPLDTDGDQEADCIDLDDDNDSYPDTEDLFPLDAQEWSDNDLDGIGDNADLDDDNDEYLDQDEIECQSDPLDRSSTPEDFDGDLLPDCVDEDDDNDNCPDIEDDFPLDSNYCKDTDGDGIDDSFDFDSDNDGVPDYRDAFPEDPNGSVDTDGDGIPDSQDNDKNNDGFPDDQIIISTALTPNQPGVESTWKIINVEDYPFTSVKVYAQDGSVVYESNNYLNDWNGTNQRTGQPLPKGPYYFRISLGGTSNEVKDGWLYMFN